MQDALRTRLSKREVEELVDSLETMPYRDDRHAEFITECLLGIFNDDGNRAMIVKVLSAACPQEMHIHFEIEFWLAPDDDSYGAKPEEVAKIYAKNPLYKFAAEKK